MSGISEEELLGCARAIDDLRQTVQPAQDDAEAAQQATARLWSQAGHDLGATQVARLLTRAIETGYALALRDARDGAITPATPALTPALTPATPALTPATPAPPPARPDMPTATGGQAEAPSRSQVVMSFVLGFAVFGFGIVAAWSWMTAGPLPGQGWWQLAAGIPCMIIGLGLILGGGFGGQEARQKQRGNAAVADPAAGSPEAQLRPA
jgi:hypothetical protein